MTNLELLQEIDAWLSFNNHPSKEQINELRNSIKNHISEQLNILHVIDSPIKLEPVLAEIEHINDLGKSKWYKVVYFDENWRSYADSKTLKDGEKVIRWKYVKDCL